MIAVLLKLKAKLGIDKAIFFTSLARIIQAGGGVISILLVAHCLTGVEQGFYYTFGSIIAIQVFFELGLGVIITQFVAHERVHLEEVKGKLEGDERYCSRLSSLLHFCVKWYAILAGILFVALVILGYTFFCNFYKSDIVVQWRIPWVLLVAGTSLNFVFAPISAFLEGMGKVKEIAFMRLLQQVISQALVWGGLIVGLKLYVVFLAPLVTSIIFIVYCWKKFGKLLLYIYHVDISESFSYWHEIFPLQWKIALSWISGYFIFQLFNPVLFATEGALVAGQMGMTLTVLNSIMSLSDSWISTKIPVISSYIATKNYYVLDNFFKTIHKQSIVIATIGVLMFVLTLWCLDTMEISFGGNSFSSRFLNYIPAIILSSTIIMRQIFSGWATYLRCHKQEPLMWISIIMSIACTLSTLVLGNLYGVNGMVVGYAVLTAGSVIAIYYIFKTKKSEWHNE